MSHWFCFEKFAVLFIGLLLAPVQASALQYDRVQVEPDVIAITVIGPIVPGDMDRLGSFLDALPKSDRIVAFFVDSPGGDLFEAEKIAGVVREAAVQVVVPSGSQCSSACFLIFAAAVRRYVAPDALIGVHSASDSESGQETVGSMAVTTAFARTARAFDVPPAIVGKIVSTEPSRMAWLTPADLSSMNVIVLTESSPEVKPLPPSATPSWNSSGEWVQIYSRPTLSEAISLARTYKDSFSNTGVFRAENGWFAVVIGPYAPGAGVWTRDSLVASRSIPSDSLVTQGAKFTQLVWGDAVQSTSASQPTSVERNAVEAAKNFFRATSRSNFRSMTYLRKVYPSKVRYFGTLTSKAAVLSEKRKFMRRWPDRAYAIRPGSVSTSCVASEQTCTVTGKVDWRAHSAARNTTSAGTARFQLTFRTRGYPHLVSEWSEVLMRDIRKG
jgi:hypothetical protein